MKLVTGSSARGAFAFSKWAIGGVLADWAWPPGSIKVIVVFSTRDESGRDAAYWRRSEGGTNNSPDERRISILSGCASVPMLHAATQAHGSAVASLLEATGGALLLPTQP